MPTESARPLRALFVEDNEDGTVGGSHVCLRNLVVHFDPAVVRPVVLFYQPNRIADEIARAGIETHIWREQRQQEILPPGGILRRPRVAARLVTAIARRVRFLVQHRIDVVHLNNNPGLGFDDWLPACKLSGRPCIAHVRGYQPEPARWIWSWLKRNFDHYVPISRTIENELRSLDYDMSRSTVVFDAIDEPEMLRRISRTPAEVRAELGLREGQLLAIMAGHIREWKGQAAVLRGLARLPQDLRDRLVVAFAGGVSRGCEGYYQEMLDFTAREKLTASVRFLGERSDVPDLMNSADLVIHASTTPEPWGLVILEGMLLGKLVLAARRGGPTEIITPESGILFDPDNPDELAGELTRVILDEKLRTGVSAAARARAREFGPISRTARDTEALYRDPSVRRKLRI